MEHSARVRHLTWPHTSIWRDTLAALALLVQAAFEGLEHPLTLRGIRISTAGRDEHGLLPFTGGDSSRVS